MRRWLIITVGLLLFAGIGLWSLTGQLQPLAGEAAVLNPQQRRMAIEFLDLLDAGNYDKALGMGTPALRQGLANGKLGQAWEALPAQLGPRQSRDQPRGESIDGVSMVSTRLQFPAMALDARVVFDADNSISGFWIVPAQARPTPPTAAPATTKAPRQHELTINDDGVALPASLSLPPGSAPFAAVVLVHGSGPHDRDETIGPNKPFLDLASGLAAHGIAVLRYEKRTLARPDLFAHSGFTVDDETVDDALAAVALLRKQTEIDANRIYILGHSLGAMMAPRIAQRDEKIAGLILLAAPASKLEDIVVRQSRYLAGLQNRSDAEIEKMLGQLEPLRQAVKHLDENASDKSPLLLDLPASYWRDLNQYDPIATARSIDQPMLILQGSSDYQVTPADEFSQWRAAFATDPRVELIEYPNLNHSFMPASDPPGPADYQLPGHVDQRVIDDIATWINAKLP
jgi:uncharacterized protein